MSAHAVDRRETTLDEVVDVIVRRTVRDASERGAIDEPYPHPRYSLAVWDGVIAEHGRQVATILGTYPHAPAELVAELVTAPQRPTARRPPPPRLPLPAPRCDTCHDRRELPDDDNVMAPCPDCVHPTSEEIPA